MNETIKLHVIIPVYNAKNYLHEAVDSVLRQPYKGINVILVNDGSTDGSAELCDEIAKREERVSVIHQENGGVSAARNTGIEFVLGKDTDKDYIAFLDADDLWIANTITANLINGAVLEDKAQLIALGGAFCNQSRDRFSLQTVYDGGARRGGASSVWSVRSHLCANIYSAELIFERDIRFVEGLKYNEDKIFLMQCIFFAEQISFHPKALHVYRKNSSSAMSKVMQIEPIDYYLPIINAWIQSDIFINSKTDSVQEEFRAGRVLAGIYFMDMAADHYKHWGKRSDLEKVFNNHPNYELFVQMRPEDVSVMQYRNQQLLLRRPHLYMWKYNIIGVFEFIARKLLRQKSIQNLWEKKQYPLTQMPKN